MAVRYLQPPTNSCDGLVVWSLVSKKSLKAWERRVPFVLEDWSRKVWDTVWPCVGLV